jgi:hypothetical protein
MKRQRITFVAAAIALVAASVAFASAPSAEAPTRIRADLVYTGLVELDHDRDGKPSIGDMAVAPAIYVNAAGKRLGHGSATCVQVNASGTRHACEGQNHFPGGDIFTATRFTVTERTFQGAILGGTGVYTGMGGTIEGRWLAADFSKARVSFELSR